MISSNVRIEMKYLFYIFFFIFFSCESSTEPDEQVNKLFLSAEKTSISVGEQNTIFLKVQNLPKSIFALSLQFDYDNSILKLSETATVTNGDFFNQDAILFAKENNSTVHCSISQIKGDDLVTGTGTICSFVFEGKSTGSSVMQIDKTTVHFYDSEGDEISISDLKFQAASVSVN